MGAPPPLSLTNAKLVVERFSTSFEEIEKHFKRDVERMCRAFSLGGGFDLENEEAVGVALEWRVGLAEW